MRRIIVFVLLVTAASCVRRPPAPAGPPPGPPAKKALVPIEIPRREGAPAVVLYPVEVRGAPLLPAEVERMRRWAGRLLATQNAVPMDVVPPEDVTRFADLAASRRMSAEAPACAGTVPLWVTLQKNFPAAMRGRPVAECDNERCRLSVTVTKAGSSEVVGSWTADVPKPYGFEQWEASAQALAPGAPPASPVAAGPGSAAGDFARIRRVGAFGDWEHAPDRAAMERWDAVFERCHEQGQPPRPEDTVALELSAQGKVTACGAYGSDKAPRALLDCYCQGFKSADFGAGGPNRRLAITVQDRSDSAVYTPDRERIDSRIEAFSASDPALEQDAFSGLLPWAGLCYADTRLRETLAIEVKLGVDPLGKIESTELTHPSAPPALMACIDGYLRNVALPCTLSGAAATVTFTLEVARQPSPAAQANAAR